MGQDGRGGFGGRCTLLCGDCLELLDEIEPGSVDLCIADMPYCATARNEWDVPIDLGALWPKLLRACRENAAIALFGQGMFTAQLMQSQPKLWRYNLVWHKTTPTGFLNANRMPLRAHEDIAVFYRKLPTYHPQKTGGHPRKTSRRSNNDSTVYGTGYASCGYDSTERHPTSVLTFSTDKQKGAQGRLHPTQKPVDLLRWLVRSYSDPGDMVLDFTMGSGSTGVAALAEGRRFTGMELDEGYYRAACERVLAAGGEGMTKRDASLRRGTGSPPANFRRRAISRLDEPRDGGTFHLHGI